MHVQLTPSLKLTTEHAACRYGIPVLLAGPYPQAFGPKDILTAYPSWGPGPAAVAVKRAYATQPFGAFTPGELDLIRVYLRQWPEGPQLD